MIARSWLVAAALSVCAVLTGIGVPSRALAADVAAPAAERRVMVMLNLAADHFRAGGGYGGDYSDAVSKRLRLRLARKLARDHRLTLVEDWPMPLIGVDCVVMEITDDRAIDAVARELSAEPGVSWSQPLNQFQMQGTAASPYNDKLYPAQPASLRWHLSSLHRIATGRGQTIAVIDSRVDVSHPDFAGQAVQVVDFVSGNRMSAERHGTSVAGIIAARPNNAMGIVGVAPGARILALRACWERSAGGSTVCDSLSLAKALTYAVEHGASVINLSLTGPQDRLLVLLIDKGLARDITVVAAVDDKHPASSFPALISGVVPVADEHLSAGGSAVYIAPGLDVPTTEPEGKWNLVTGSSYAAAHVSGLAALLRQAGAMRRSHTPAAAMLGPLGTIDACAALARVSALDAGLCRKRD